MQEFTKVDESLTCELHVTIKEQLRSHETYPNDSDNGCFAPPELGGCRILYSTKITPLVGLKASCTRVNVFWLT
jgi:hypothetical protein